MRAPGRMDPEEGRETHGLGLVDAVTDGLQVAGDAGRHHPHGRGMVGAGVHYGQAGSPGGDGTMLPPMLGTCKPQRVEPSPT